MTTDTMPDLKDVFDCGSVYYMSETLPDLKKVIERVRKLAAANPDFVYQTSLEHRGCDYVRYGKPSCLLGQAFYAEGVSLETLKVWDDAGPFETVVDELLDSEDYDQEDVAWLQASQYAQDRSVPWGEAVELSDRVITKGL